MQVLVWTELSFNSMSFWMSWLEKDELHNSGMGGQLGWVSLVFFGVAHTHGPPTWGAAFSAGRVGKILGLSS